MAEKPPPPRHMTRPEWCNLDGSTLGSGVHFHSNIPPIHHPCTGHQIWYLFGIVTFEGYRTENHGASGKAIGSPTTIHTNITATSFRLLGIGLQSIDIRYGMYSREERSQANDAGEVIVGYLVIICNYITAITYRLLAMGLGRKEKTPPPKETSFNIGQMTWHKLARGLPPITKDYLPGTITRLVVEF